MCNILTPDSLTPEPSIEGPGLHTLVGQMTIFLRCLLVGDTGEVTWPFLGTETLLSVGTELNARDPDK